MGVEDGRNQQDTQFSEIARQWDEDEEARRFHAYLEEQLWYEEQELERRLWEEEEQRRIEEEEAAQQAAEEQELEDYLEWQEWQRQEEERRELEYLNSLSIEERREYLKRQREETSNARWPHSNYGAIRAMRDQSPRLLPWRQADAEAKALDDVYQAYRQALREQSEAIRREQRPIQDVEPRLPEEEAYDDTTKN